MPDSKYEPPTQPTEDRPDYWDGYHQAMLGHPVKPEGGAEYLRGRADGLASFANKLAERQAHG